VTRRAGGALLALALEACLTVGCHSSSRKVELSLFAAASLQDALRAASAAYRQNQPDVRVELNFAGSNALAQQIAASHAADVFFSADEKWMDFLARRHLLVVGSRVALLTNALVIVARKDSSIAVLKPEDLASARYAHLVLANPDAVPAGRYAKQYLESVHAGGKSLWDEVSARVVPALDVRAALAAVAADPDRVGIVYASDLVASHDVHALYRVPPGAGPPIRYPVALIAGRPHLAEARRLLAFLESPQANAVYRRFGFESLGASR
jgi:molybdate transport system substrate-binding protein